MLKKILLPLVVVLASCSSTNTAMPQKDEHTGHSEASSAVVSMDRLNNSPRHQEWVEIDNNGKKIYTWVVYPQTDKPTPVVVLIHENKGLNDWARSMADQVAEAGYIAVAPDLLSGVSSTYTRTSDFPSDDERTKALSALDPKGVMSDLQAVANWAKAIPAANGKLVSAGFCWGGARSFEFATVRSDLAATLVFYGTGPTDPAAYQKISSPVFGFYGGDDARVNATLNQSVEQMSLAGKTFAPETYAGAGHAFMRSGEDPNGKPENMAARDAAWQRMQKILSDL
jgi:carboxymethylenebutenolidase